MKSKYFLTLFLAALGPVAALAGLFYWVSLNEKPAAAAPAMDQGALSTSVTLLQTQISTLASTLQANITSTYKNLPNLVANHSDADLDNFQKSHPGLAGLVVFSNDGKVQKMVPATAQLADQAYGSSAEFKQLSEKLQGNGGKVDLFYTTRLNYPAFVFSVTLDAKTFVQAIMNLAYFFPNSDPQNGEMVFLDGESGQILYDSNPSKNQTVFNPNQDPWLERIQKAIQGKQTGNDLNPPVSAAVFASVGIKAFGLAHLVPFSVFQPKSEAPAPRPSGTLDLLKSQDGMKLVVGVGAVCLAWIIALGLLGQGLILAPLRKASAVVLNAAQGKGALDAKTVQSFGKDDVGQMVQSAAILMQRLEEDKQAANQEKEDAIRRARAEADAKSKEAAAQVASAQQAAAAARNEANDKNQQLNDKLKELDAMKSMSEGLRNQNEQAKAENGKLKGQLAEAEQERSNLQLQVTQTQYKMEGQLKEMEIKLLSAVAASSAIQVSQVRAAAIRTMSEELKTTLGIIKGYVSSALGAAQGGINEKQQEFLGMVINRSARLEKFINDLLDIYQVEIETATAPHEEVVLASEIEGLAFNFQAQADVKNIKLKVESKGTMPKVPIVRRRFNQLWNILYLQMIKDAPRGSNITIGVEPIGDSVKVTVQDPGLVVAPESLPKLFDEFYDPKHPASPQLAGTGLKFALVKTILAAHGGGAVAEAGDPGTRLTLTFPTQVKKPGEASLKPLGAVPPSPSLTAPGAKLAPPPIPGATPKPPAPGTVAASPKPAPPAAVVGKPATPGAPAAPGAVKPPTLTPTPGVVRPAAPGASPAAPPAAPVPSAPKSPAAGFLDSLISKTQPVNVAPGAKPPVPGVPPAAPKPPVPGSPTPMAPAVPKPPAPTVPPQPGAGPSIPAAPPTSGVTAPSPMRPGALDALLDKKPAALSSAAPPPPPAPMATPIPKPPTPPMPGAPPASPSANPATGPGIKLPVPPVPGAPPVPGPIPSTSSPQAGAPMPPKVVPTTMKPTTPLPGILDMDNLDGVKTAVPPKPAAPPMPPKLPMPGAPGAPLPPAGTPNPSSASGPRPPAPGIPPGGLDASKAQKPKEEGDLIE